MLLSAYGLGRGAGRVAGAVPPRAGVALGTRRTVVRQARTAAAAAAAAAWSGPFRVPELLDERGVDVPDTAKALLGDVKTRLAPGIRDYWRHMCSELSRWEGRVGAGVGKGAASAGRARKRLDVWGRTPECGAGSAPLRPLAPPLRRPKQPGRAPAELAAGL